MYLQYPGSGGAGASGIQLFKANCLDTDVVGNAVYVSSDKVGSLYQVTTVDITDKIKMPAFGIISRKSSLTECWVQFGGIIKNYSSGMTPNDRFFIGDDGKITAMVPVRPVSGIKFVQVVARAASSEDIAVKIEHPLILRA